MYKDSFPLLGQMNSICPQQTQCQENFPMVKIPKVLFVAAIPKPCVNCLSLGYVQFMYDSIREQWRWVCSCMPGAEGFLSADRAQYSAIEQGGGWDSSQQPTWGQDLSLVQEIQRGREGDELVSKFQTTEGEQSETAEGRAGHSHSTFLCALVELQQTGATAHQCVLGPSELYMPATYKMFSFQATWIIKLGKVNLFET